MMETRAGSASLNVRGRLDRLPFTSLHRLVVIGLAFAYFFELGDLSTFAFAAPGIIKAWHISINDVALITSLSFGGMFIGASAGGWFADRIGRKRAIIWSVAVYTLSSLLNAFAWNVASLGVLRFCTGIGLSAVTIIANAYISEFFPTKSRGRYMAIVFTIGLVGIPLTAWFSRAVVPMADWGWRLVFIWGALGAIALVMLSRIVELPRWLEIKGRSEEAESALASIEQLATREFGSLPTPEQTARGEIVPHVPYRELFARPYALRTTMLSAVWALQTLGFYGFAAWVPTLLTKQGFSVVHSLAYTSVMTIGSPLGALMAISLAERVERKWFITLDSVLIIICGLLYGFSSEPFYIMLFGFLTVFFLQAFPTILSSYTPELFPTPLRSSGMGITYGIGRLANTIGPFIVATLYASVGYESVFVYIAACWAAAALAVGIFGPSTTQRSLEELNAESPGASMPVTNPARADV